MHIIISYAFSYPCNSPGKPVLLGKRLIGYSFGQQISRHTIMCQRPRETQDAQCVIYRKRKVPDFNPLYLGNYLMEFY